MKVLYDYQVFASQRVGGISRYFYELINSSQNIFSPHLAIKYHKNIYLEKVLESLPYPRKSQFFGERSFPGKGILGRIKEQYLPTPDPVILNQVCVRDQLSLVKPDVFHPTYYGDYFLDDLRRTPFILTIYDMIHEVFPEHFKKDNTSILKKKLYNQADHVIAISETTKKDIIDIYNVSGDKISVVHLANSLVDISDTFTSMKLKLPSRYLLFVGQRWVYKNFEFFITAISELLKRDDELQLVCTGAPFNKKEKDFFDFFAISHKIHHYFASDSELKCLYKNAEAFIFPSLYEGFGIPILEAFTFDCPALLSQSGSLPEIAGDAAIYFDPKSANDIRNSIKKVIYDSDFRQILIRKGRERLKNFSWDKTVKKTGEIYKKCVSTY